MQNLKTTVALVLAGALLGSCGGGGGGGGGDADFAGTWRGLLTTTSNSCTTSEPPFNAILLVNQDGDRIAVNSATTGIAFQGFTTSETSFIATHEETGQCVDSRGNPGPSGATYSALSTYQFTNVDGDSASVSWTWEASDCPFDSQNSSCTIVQAGQFLRD